MPIGRSRAIETGKKEDTANVEIARITGIYDGTRTGRFGFATFNAAATFRPLGCGKLGRIVPVDPPCKVRHHASTSSDSDSDSTDSYSVDSADSYSADSYSIDSAEKALGDDDDDDDDDDSDSDSDSSSGSNSVSDDSSGCYDSTSGSNSVSDDNDDSDTAESALGVMYMQERDSALSTAEQISQKTATRALATVGFISICVFGYSRIFAPKEYISIKEIPEEEI